MEFGRIVVFLPGLAAFLALGPAAAEPPTCVAIQRGALGEVADTSLVSFGSLADRNFGEERQLYVGKTGSVEARALLRFDLGEIPPRAEITSATVTLGEPSDSGPLTIEVHRITAPWDERLATWPRSAAAFDPAVEATFTTRGPTGGGAVRFDLTPRVRAWASGAGPNNGVLLASRDPGLTELCSSEYLEAKRRPRLSVCFNPPPPSNALSSTRVEGRALATDSAGNAIVIDGDHAVLITKLDRSGKVLWTRRFESLDAYGSAITVDRTDNILITGAYRDSIDLGAVRLDDPHRGTGVAFVAKLDPQGQVLWARTAAGHDRQYPHGIAADAAGDVIVTGSFEGDFTFTGESERPGPGAYEDIFLAKFSPAGELLWEKRFGGGSTDRAYGIAIGRGDDILLTGFGSRSLDLGGGPPGETDSDAFVARLAPDGNPRWGRRFGDATGVAIAVDATDDIVVGVNRTSVFHVGGGPSAPPASGVTVRKLAARGSDVWSKRFGDATRDTLRIGSLAIDAAGNIVLAGTMTDDIDLGGGPLKHVGKGDIFLARFGPAGEHLRSMAFGDPSDQAGLSVAADPGGNVLLLAGGEGRTYYGPGLLVGPGLYVTRFGW